MTGDPLGSDRFCAYEPKAVELSHCPTDFLRCIPSGLNAVRDPNSLIGRSRQGQAWDLLDRCLDTCNAVEVTDVVLGERFGPSRHSCQERFAAGAQGCGNFLASQLDQGVPRFVHDLVLSGPTNEQAEQHVSGWRSVGELAGRPTTCNNWPAFGSR